MLIYDRYRHRDIDVSDMLVSVTMDGGSPAARLEPVALATAKKQLRFGSSAEDDLIGGWISAARTIFEEESGRQAVDAVWEYGMNCAPWQVRIELPRPPLADVVEITYDDVNGDAQTMDPTTYIVEPSFLSADAIDPYCAPGRVKLAKGASWPATNGEPRSFRIRRTCGYGATIDAIPPLVQSMIYLLVAHFHRNRSEVFEAKTRGGDQVLPLGAQALMGAFKYTALTLQKEHIGWR